MNLCRMVDLIKNAIFDSRSLFNQFCFSSVLLPSTNDHNNGLRHRQFSLHTISGFNNKVIKSLSDKGTILINDDTLYYVNKSNFYIT